MNKEWFRLGEVELNTERYNNFVDLEKELKHAKKITRDGWDNDYIKINANLTFLGKLNTPSGEVDTEFDYYIKTTYRDMLKEAKITIYEQTFTGLNEAVTIRFSSGSIISKIVFGDIEKCYSILKESVGNLIEKYNHQVEEFNKKIDALKESESEK